ncbi:MAG: hypothetical protein QMD92_01310 [bacterium]|nr:hypothetical protein [bacterium]
MKYNLKMLPTAIGSLPYQDVGKAVEIVLENLPDIPICFQLPNVSFYENMYVQYSEKMPCLVLDLEHEKIYFDTNKQYYKELEIFYQAYLEKDADYFAITPKFSVGFYALLNKVKDDTLSKYIKAQVTGPISFAMTVTDQNKRAIYYHKEIFEAIVKGLSMKAYWQAKKIKDEGYIPLIFIDEPYLSVIGSAYTSIKKEEVINSLNEIITLIKEAGGISGIHCCANTDWSILCKSKADIISFDAYNYLDSISLYKEDLVNFLNKGNYLAYGIVPTSIEIANENIVSLTNRLQKSISILLEQNIVTSSTKDNFIITPSCGMGTLSEGLTIKVLRLTKELSKITKEKIV